MKENLTQKNNRILIIKNKKNDKRSNKINVYLREYKAGLCNSMYVKILKRQSVYTSKWILHFYIALVAIYMFRSYIEMPKIQKNTDPEKLGIL